MEKQIEKIRQYIILALIFLFPFTFAGTFIDQLLLPKLILLAVMICLLLITIAIQFYLTGKISFAKGRFDLPVLAIVLAYLISALFMSPNKVEAFFIPGNASLILGLGILYFLINTVTNKEKIKMTLIGSGVIMSVLIFGSFLGVFEKIPQLPSFMKLPTFNPAGDYLTGTIFLAVVIPLSIFFMIKEKDLPNKLVLAFCTIFILTASVISLFTLVSNNKKAFPILPTYETSWAVAVDTIRESPALGIGPGNYLTAFGRFRPPGYNLTDLWQIRFATGTNWYLTVLTETGLLGIIGIILLVFTIIKLIEKSISIWKESRSIMFDGVSMVTLILLLLSVLLFPGTPVILLLIFVFLGLNSASKIQTYSLEGVKFTTPRLIISIALIALVLFFGYKVQPVIMAEAKFKSANDALIANDGKGTYDNLQQAISLNPYVDRYHASYAQVNLAIARSIVQSVKDPKDLKDDQKNTISQLIQQAIREGQNTVALNPTRAANWQVLANVYQIIIPFATQADQFAIQSYNQTIVLDPIDPNLRIALGQLYYSLGQYDNAISSFQFATLAKPDLANAYYNLAASYAAKNDFTNAVAYMTKVLTLVKKDSNDYKIAQKDLDTLQKKQKSLQDATNSSNLTNPQKQTGPTINPQLNLPSEASPPAGPKLPTTPNPSPTAPTTEGGLPLPTNSPTPKPSSTPIK